jgi:hypothetical protein
LGLSVCTVPDGGKCSGADVVFPQARLVEVKALKRFNQRRFKLWAGASKTQTQWLPHEGNAWRALTSVHHAIRGAKFCPPQFSGVLF